MITTANMSLIAWNSPTDYYSNSQLSGNFITIDGHDHSSGKGVLLGTNSISSNAITWGLINPGAVQGSAGPNGTNIYPGSITTTEIANNTILATQLAATVFSAVVPIGTIISWYTPNSQPYPTSWVITDGSTYMPAQHNFPNELGNVTVPNLAPYAAGLVFLIKIRNDS